MPPILLAIASSALRCASLIAATIRSCSISTSSFETTSGSIFSDCTCLRAVDDDRDHAAAGVAFDPELGHLLLQALLHLLRLLHHLLNIHGRSQNGCRVPRAGAGCRAGCQVPRVLVLCLVLCQMPSVECGAVWCRSSCHL